MGSTVIAPPPSALQSVLGGAYKWLVDTLNKLSNTQSQVNSTISVIGLTVKPNTPDGTDISWSACTVWLNGTPYPIAAGNTTGGALLVWWTVGAAAFTSGNSFTPSPTTFPILTNVAGTADTTWNKVGASSVQASQVIGGLLPPGYQVQTPATATLNANGITTLLTFVGAGALLTFGLVISGSPSFTSLSLSINVDGGGAVSYDVADTGAPSQPFLLTSTTGGGTTVTNFNIPFKSSIVVQVTLAGYVSGGVPVGVGWAAKTA